MKKQIKNSKPELTLQQKIEELSSLPNGMYEIKASQKLKWYQSRKPEKLGWVEIEHKEDRIEFMWCNEKASHNPLCGYPAFSITLDAQRDILYYMESVLSMHIRWAKHNSSSYNSKYFDRAISHLHWIHEKLC